MSQLSLVLASKYCFNFVKWIPEKSFVGKKQKTEKFFFFFLLAIKQGALLTGGGVGTWGGV